VSAERPEAEEPATGRQAYRSVQAYKHSGDASHLSRFYASDYYGRVHSLPPKAKVRRKYPFIAKAIGPAAGDILDVGCATRTLACEALSQVGRYHGFDVNPAFHPDYRGDIHEIGRVVDRRFDWLVFANTLEFVHDPVAVLRQCRDLAPRIAVMVPMWFQLQCLALPRAWRAERDRYLHSGGGRFWRRLLQAGGYRPYARRGFAYVPSIAFNSRRRGLQAVDDWLARNQAIGWLDRRVMEPLSAWPLLRGLAQEQLFLAERA